MTRTLESHSRADLRKNSSSLLALLLIFLVAIVLRSFAAAEFLWLDELHTAWVANGPWSELIGRAADGNQSPLYFAGVAVLTKLFGATPFVLRVFSLFCGILVWVSATSWTLKLTRSRVAAILVAAIVATDIQFVLYSSEARPYVLVQLLGLWQAMTFWGIVGQSVSDSKSKSSSSFWQSALFVLLSVALFYSHFTSVWILFGEAVFCTLIFIFSLGNLKRSHLAWFLVCSLLTVLLCVPAVWNLLNVFSRRSNWVNMSEIGRVWQELIPWLGTWVLGPGVLLISVKLWRLLNGPDTNIHQQSNDTNIQNCPLPVFLLVWGLMGPLAIIAIDWFEIAPTALVRYSAVSWVALAIFAGVCVSSVSVRWQVVFSVSILAASLWQNLLVTDCLRERAWVPYRNENWHDAACEIVTHNSKSPIFLFADVIEDVDANEITDARFQKYLQFPILGIDQVATDGILEREYKIAALPTFPVEDSQKVPTRWKLEQLNKIHQRGSAWLIIRGEKELADHVIEDLRYSLDAPDAPPQTLRVNFAQFSRPENNLIRLYRIELNSVFTEDDSN